MPPLLYARWNGQRDFSFGTCAVKMPTMLPHMPRQCTPLSRPTMNTAITLKSVIRALSADYADLRRFDTAFALIGAHLRNLRISSLFFQQPQIKILRRSRSCIGLCQVRD